MMKTRTLLTVAFAAALGSSAFATITIRFDGTALGQGIDFVYNGAAESAFAGQLNFTDLTHNVGLQTYCVDLDHHIGGGQTYDVNVSHTLGAPSYQTEGSIVTANYASVADNDSATALQIAVWATHYGTDLSTNSGGTFQLDSNWYATHGSIVSLAQNMIANGTEPTRDGLLYMPDPRDGGQAQLGPVPEPASIVALGAGLAAVLRKRRARV